MFLLTITFSLEAVSNKSIIAYYQNYSQFRPATENRPVFKPAMIDPTLMTDLYYAFAYFGYVTASIEPSNPHLTGNFQIYPTEANDITGLYPEIKKLKERSPSLRLILSVGGWNFNDPQDPQGNGSKTYRLFSQMIENEKNRREFIDSAISYLKKYSFDGLDIDWEFPGDLTRGGSESDFKNLVDFFRECQSAFKEQSPNLYLSFTTPAHVPGGISSSFLNDPKNYFRWLAECTKYTDRVLIMAYDYHGPFNHPKITGANTPLMRDTDPNSPYYIEKTLENFLDNGVPADKIVLGLATFGHTYRGVEKLTLQDYGPGKPFEDAGAPGPATKMPGFLAYFEITDLIKNKKLTFGTDSTTQTALGYNLENKEWASFDTPETIALKVQLAVKKGLQGVMVWAVDMDEYAWEPKYPNLRTAWEEIQK